MEKEITTTNQTTALADSLIVVQQLPIIKEQLHSIKAQAQESVKEALSLACTEETLKVVKERRAALNRDRKDLDARRMAVKKQIMQPFEDFDALKCLEYNTIQKPSANDVVSATLRVAREKVEKLPVAQEGALLSFWRDPDKDPPKVETEVLILFETACGGYGITTAHYEDGTVLSEKSKFYWEEIFEWGTYDEEHDDYLIPKGWWEYRYFNPEDVYNNRVDSPVVGWMPLPPKEVVKK